MKILEYNTRPTNATKPTASPSFETTLYKAETELLDIIILLFSDMRGALVVSSHRSALASPASSSRSEIYRGGKASVIGEALPRCGANPLAFANGPAAE